MRILIYNDTGQDLFLTYPQRGSDKDDKIILVINLYFSRGTAKYAEGVDLGPPPKNACIDVPEDDIENFCLVPPWGFTTNYTHGQHSDDEGVLAEVYHIKALVPSADDDSEESEPPETPPNSGGLSN